MYGRFSLYSSQAKVENAENSCHYNGNRGDIISARDHTTGSTSASQYPRHKGQHGELDLREGYYVRDTDHPGPSDNNSSFCYGIAFFIQERKAHYTELNQRVFQPLTFLQPPNIDTQNHRNFFERLRLADLSTYNPQNSIHYHKAVMHMKKDVPDLPNMISSFFRDLKSLDNSVNKLETFVNDTIHNSFRKQSGAIHEEYRFYFECVYDVVIAVWNQILNENPNNIENAVRNLPITELREDRSGNAIRLRGFLIGEGNDEEKTKMRDIVFSIIKNEFMIEEVPNSLVSRLNLIDRMDPIRSRATEMSDALGNGTITKARCCPTIWSLIERYAL
jgi:hypothetical protein